MIRSEDGRALINLGCSAKTAPGWNNIDFSWMIRLGRRPRLARSLWRLKLVSTDRYNRIKQLSGNLILWDLRKGIPFDDRSVDVVYHSHVLEHIDREHADGMVTECRRVLKPGGYMRVVVPDLEFMARRYLALLDATPKGCSPESHLESVSAMIDQMVPRIPRERLLKPWWMQTIENVLLGDTVRTGALHRWMYDRCSLEDLLTRNGFVSFKVQAFDRSEIKDWARFGLDVVEDGKPYKHDSIYVEARKP